MGLTSALYTSLSGLNANSQAINIAGNNLANVNTTAYKAQSADFETQISETLKDGSAPTSLLGGTNPAQVGLGVNLGAVSSDFTNGTLQPTGVDTDLAIQGNGFFMVNVDGSTEYTRAGDFTLDSNSNLVSSDSGGVVQGLGVDSNFNIIQGKVQNINIPIGTLTLAQATSQVVFTGNLNSAGTVATQGSLIDSDPLYADNAATTPATATTDLDSLYNASGTQLFNVGDVITITGATKGSTVIPDATFEITDPANPDATTTDSTGHGATLQDFLTFLNNTLGIDNINSAGVTISNGQIQVQGNTGTVNDIDLSDANIVDNQGGLNPTEPFNLTKAQSANGESVSTTFVSYDSLGNADTINLSMVLEGTNNSGTTWRYYATSADNTDPSPVLGTGQLTFNTSGQFVSVVGGSSAITIDHNNTGASTPQQVNLVFSNSGQTLSALANSTSQISAVSQDGFPIGTLQSFSVSSDGTIVGSFSNSLLRNLGQVVLANFANPGGLAQAGSNLYTVSPASGTAAVVTPGSSGAGTVVGGSLELSNVDLSQEFINLIAASTGFSANSRVLTTSDQLIQDLLSAVGQA